MLSTFGDCRNPLSSHQINQTRPFLCSLWVLAMRAQPADRSKTVKNCAHIYTFAALTCQPQVLMI
jgi:hypothetical protein